MPLIASLTLSATRTLRVRRAMRLPHAMVEGSADVMDYNMPHNSLLIMWSGMQKGWTHQVPFCKHVAAHSIGGTARISLTFRRCKEKRKVGDGRTNVSMSSSRSDEGERRTVYDRKNIKFSGSRRTVMPRHGRKAAPAAVATGIANASPVTEEGHTSVEEILQMIQAIDGQVEERVAAVVSAAEDAIISLRNDLKTKIVRLPKATRDMPLKEFQEKYPEDFKTGALQEIRERYAAMAAAAAQHPIPSTALRGSRTDKRALEAPTVLRTVRARRGAHALAPSVVTEVPAAPSADTAAPSRRTARPRTGANGDDNSAVDDTGAGIDAAPPQAPASSRPAFAPHNGLPLQTPLPFAGTAIALPITMLAQKRGGRTKAAPAPDAVVVSTADGKQWALGKEGVAGIPESHRAEVAEMLQQQFQFLSAALGKTVFDRPVGRGGRKG